MDAISLLTADHNRVRGLFTRFREAHEADDTRTMVEVAGRIFEELEVHTTIEEEIFYPAFLEATDDKDMHHEAEIEHEGAKNLIAQIEESSPDDEYFDSKVKVLSEMIKHHVKEEEQPGGMFAEARKSEMDLLTVGQELKARKEQLEG